jgi:hypothetical protein
VRTLLDELNDTAAALVGKSHWRGELLDGGVLAAQRLNRPDVARRLAAAWQAAPTLVRLMRWLVAADQDPTALRARATKALTRCPRTAGRQVGLLRLLTGDISGAAESLSAAPGLGWSSEDHPGPVLFPSFAVQLAQRTAGRVSDTLLANLESTCRNPLDDLSRDNAERGPRLGTPSIVALIKAVSSSMTLSDMDQNAMMDAMRITATKRVDGILGHSRRRHYSHAALLVGQCMAVAPATRRKALYTWLIGLQQTHSRRHAFKEELTRAMGNLGVSMRL